MNILVSVIIPFYSNFEWLEQALESVFNQTYTNIEIIIINDGSVEDDNSFLEHYGERIKYIKTTNNGPGYARNTGIEKSNGEYIAFLDSDDLWHPKKIETQLTYMINNKLDWSHTNYELFSDASKETFKHIEVSNFIGDVFLRCFVSCPIATPCVMISNSFLSKHKNLRFSNKMRYGEDGYLWISIAQHIPLGMINQSLTKVRMRGSNATLSAAVHLKVKAELWNVIKNEAKSNEKFKVIPKIIMFSYWLSYKNNSIHSSICKYFTNSINDTIARALYLPSFIILKFYKYIIY